MIHTHLNLIGSFQVSGLFLLFLRWIHIPNLIGSFQVPCLLLEGGGHLPSLGEHVQGQGFVPPIDEGNSLLLALWWGNFQTVHNWRLFDK